METRRVAIFLYFTLGSRGLRNPEIPQKDFKATMETF